MDLPACSGPRCGLELEADVHCAWTYFICLLNFIVLLDPGRIDQGEVSVQHGEVDVVGTCQGKPDWYQGHTFQGQADLGVAYVGPVLVDYDYRHYGMLSVAACDSADLDSKQSPPASHQPTRRF